MNQEYKSSVRNAILNFTKKNMRHPKRKNKAPEKDTVYQCMKWMRSHGFSVDTIEVSTFDARTGRNMAQKMKAGIPDCIGNLKSGRAVYVEF